MRSWKEQVAKSIVAAPAPTAPVNPDAALAEALRAKIDAGEISERDRSFATSLLAGFARYQNFTDRQRPHVERLVAPAPAAGSPDKALGEALVQALTEGRVGWKDLAFASSLAHGFKQYGSFTDRQRPHVERLLAAHQLEAAPQEPAKAPESPQATRCPNICAKVSLNGFSRFTVGSLALSLKNDGTVIWVKWDGRIAGSIDTASTVYRATYRYLSHNALKVALEALLKVEADPLAAARENGVKTGRCSCCGRPLTDPTSIEFGIGPVCRERGWGVAL